MSGRHRMPTARSRRAAVVAVAGAASVTGTIALPAVAHADSSVDWDAVAQCESGGNWSTDTDNGFTGGLQFTDSTWHAYGGTTAHAHQASRSAQIAVAERVLDGQGIGAWPVCGSRGLGGHITHRGSATSSTERTVTRSASTTSRRVPAAASPTVPAPARPSPVHTHTVRPGDTLGRIADQYRVPRGWRGLQAMNDSVVRDPNMIFPGQALRVA